MESFSQLQQPLISVIITCYNHGRYLSNAINSILAQEAYKNVEIVVVDDGSVDNTKQECLRFPDVIYVYQENMGLSAARNTGIESSKGEYLVFLDADDWLLPAALITNATYILQQPSVAFVSGAHQYLYEEENILLDITSDVTDNHYCHLLQINYIAMHATVLYQRWAFKEVRFDTTLKACEDYDVYLRLARLHPVLNHQQLIAVYRIHNTNMSGNNLLMLNCVLEVLKRQEPLLQNESEWQCYRKGIKTMQAYYTEEMYKKILQRPVGEELKDDEMQAMQQFNIKRYNELLKRHRLFKMELTLKKFLPAFAVKRILKVAARLLN